MLNAENVVNEPRKPVVTISCSSLCADSLRKAPAMMKHNKNVPIIFTVSVEMGNPDSFGTNLTNCHPRNCPCRSCQTNPQKLLHKATFSSSLRESTVSRSSRFSTFPNWIWTSSPSRRMISPLSEYAVLDRCSDH